MVAALTVDGAAPSNHCSRREEIQEELDELFRLHDEGAGELLLVRHGEPSREAASYGDDPMLSCRGLDQAERLALRLGTLWVAGIVSAPERRAQQTARIVAAQLECSVELDGDLRDTGYESAHASSPWRRGDYARLFGLEPRWRSLPGFEDGKTFRRRAIQSIESAIAAHPARRVVVVTHASAINAYLSMLLGIERDVFFAPEHTSVSVVRWQDGAYAVRALNDLSHLSPPGVTSAACR